MSPEQMRIYLVDYDAAWPRRFLEERTRLFAAVGHGLVGVEHIGSTAIPGMRAKPVLDIMALVPDIAEAPKLYDALAELQYHYFPYAEEKTPERRWLCKPDPAQRTHHLHLVESGSAFQRDHLLFRDHLIASPEAAARYQQLKETLAARHPDDREAYTEGKTELVNEILAEARRAEPPRA